jgi:hypothetical protein
MAAGRAEVVDAEPGLPEPGEDLTNGHLLKMVILWWFNGT